MPLPNVIVPGYLAGASDYYELARLLQAQGLPTVIVPLKWWEWLPTVGGKSIAPILLRLDATVRQTLAQFSSDRVNIIAHSAGGWISRIYLGKEPYYAQVWNGRDRVAKLITLGTPQMSQEPWTKKNLDFVNDNYPDAFHQEVQYVCVAGKAVQGQKNLKNLGDWIAYNSYELTCGQGNVWGDGITPIAAAHLAGAENITLAGVKHSPRSGTWYGSPEVVAVWSKYLY